MLAKGGNNEIFAAWVRPDAPVTVLPPLSSQSVRLAVSSSASPRYVSDAEPIY
jgi:hypothetical protein